MGDPAMVCTCCGNWRVTLVKLERMPGYPRQLLRITSHGTNVADVYTVEEVDQVLRRYGVDIANFVPAATSSLS